MLSSLSSFSPSSLEGQAAPSGVGAKWGRRVGSGVVAASPKLVSPLCELLLLTTKGNINTISILVYITHRFVRLCECVWERICFYKFIINLLLFYEFMFLQSLRILRKGKEEWELEIERVKRSKRIVIERGWMRISEKCEWCGWVRVWVVWMSEWWGWQRLSGEDEWECERVVRMSERVSGEDEWESEWWV